MKAAAGEPQSGGRSGVKAAAPDNLHSRYWARTLLVIIFAASAAALYSRSGAVEWFVFAITSALVLCAWVVPYAVAGRITVERMIERERELVDGGDMMVRLIIRLSRPMPLMWLKVDEHIANRTVPQHAAIYYRTAAIPGFSRELTLNYIVKGLQRGELAFAPVRISIGDLLGLTIRTIDISCPSGPLVRPLAPAGERLGGIPGSLPGANASEGKPIAALAGMSLTAAARVSRDGIGPEVRAYTPGDSLRRVDWRAMARGLGMQTKISNAEHPSEVVILLEASEKAYGKDLRLFDANAGRAVMAAKIAFEEGKGITILSNSREEERITIRAGDRKALRLAEDRLSGICADGTKPLFAALTQTIGQLSRGAAVICLGAGFTGAAGKEPQTGRAGNAGGKSLSDFGSDSVEYGARLAGVRGVRLYLLLAYDGADAQQGERDLLEKLNGTGFLVKGMPVPAGYLGKAPVAMEGGYADVSASIS